MQTTYVLRETFEDDDDYGQPSAREVNTSYSTLEEAMEAQAKSSADFCTEIITVEV